MKFFITFIDSFIHNHINPFDYAIIIFVFILSIVALFSFLRKYSVIPVVGALCCLYLMIEIPAISWLWFFVWMGIGLVFYALYGSRKSKLNENSPQR